MDVRSTEDFSEFTGLQGPRGWKLIRNKLRYGGSPESSQQTSKPVWCNIVLRHRCGDRSDRSEML